MFKFANTVQTDSHGRLEPRTTSRIATLGKVFHQLGSHAPLQYSAQHLKEDPLMLALTFDRPNLTHKVPRHAI